MEWRKGDFVECVENSAGLTRGKLYCLEEVWPDALYDGCGAHGDDCVGFGVTVTSVTLSHDDECFCSMRFRLIYRRDIDLFKRLAMPVRQNEFTIQTKERKGGEA